MDLTFLHISGSLNYLKIHSTKMFGKKIIITNPEAKIPRYFSSLENIQYLHENSIVNKNNSTEKKKKNLL